MYRQRFVEQVLKIVTSKEQARLPSAVKDWVEARKNSRGIYEFSWLEHDYLLISLGFRPNPGYRIEVTKVGKSDGEITVVVKEELPEPGKMYPQIIIYPYILAEIKEKGKVRVQRLIANGELAPFC
jgi:hypothetical protein